MSSLDVPYDCQHRRHHLRSRRSYCRAGATASDAKARAALTSDALALRFADGEDVSSETLVSTPQGEAASGPFAARLWGCLRRYSSLVSQTPLLSGQIARMSRARRWLQLPKGGAAMGYGIRPLAARLRGYLERGVRFAPPTPVHSETPCHLDVRRRAAAREEGGRRRKGEKGGHQVACLSAGSLAW